MFFAIKNVKRFLARYHVGHGVLRGTMGHGVPRGITEDHDLLWGTRRTTGDRGDIKTQKKNFRFDTMRDTAYYGGPRGMEYHGGPRKTTIYYGGARHTTRDHREILLIFALSFDF